MSEIKPKHPAFRAGNVAVITGAASGIGLAAAKRFAGMGMRVALADLAGERLNEARATVSAVARSGAADVLAVPTDVSQAAALEHLRATVTDLLGPVNVLMNNAATGDNPGAPWSGLDGWTALLDINFRGVLHGVQAFVPGMIEAGRPGLVINTGSKQGITTPPGNPAYNVAKAAVKAYTEALAHALREAQGTAVTAHLLIPGFTFTGMTGGNPTEKPEAAWTADQVVDFMLESLDRGDFYILCPDNDVDRATDEKRMAWAIGDIIHNRPALSRWHPDYKDAFARFMAEGSV